MVWEVIVKHKIGKDIFYFNTEKEAKKFMDDMRREFPHLHIYYDYFSEEERHYDMMME